MSKYVTQIHDEENHETYIIRDNEALKASDLVSELLQKIYPVGSIYMSVNNVNPSVFIGGTWAQIQDTFLLAAGSHAAGSIGGEENHTLTTAEIPSHNHTLKSHTFTWGDISTDVLIRLNAEAHTPRTAMPSGYGNALCTHQNVDNISYYTGNGQAHNNMPPYLAVYMWKRTA